LSNNLEAQEDGLLVKIELGLPMYFFEKAIKKQTYSLCSGFHTINCVNFKLDA